MILFRFLFFVVKSCWEFFFFLASGAISPHIQTCVYRLPRTYEQDLWTKYSWLLIFDVYKAWLVLRFLVFDTDLTGILLSILT